MCLLLLIMALLQALLQSYPPLNLWAVDCSPGNLVKHGLLKH